MALLETVEARSRCGGPRVHITVERFIALAHLLPLPDGKAIAVAAGDQLLGAQLLDEFGIDLWQMNESGRKCGGHTVLKHVGGLAQVVVKLPLGDAHCHREHLDAPAQLLASLRDIHRRWCANERCTTRDTLDRHHTWVATSPHECVCLLRGKAGVECESRQRQRRSRLVRPRLGDQFGQPFPHCVAGGVAHQHTVLDQPRFLAAPEGPYRGFDAILLHVGSTNK